MAEEAARVDTWLCAVRLMPTRTRAASACRAGHVRVNGERAKPATMLRAGDTIELRGGSWPRVVVVRQLLVRRVGAELAATAYDDIGPVKPPKELAVSVAVRPRGSGKPTTRERRQLAKLKGRS